MEDEVDNGLLRAKALELLDLLNDGKAPRELYIEHFLSYAEDKVREFYDEHGQWPIFCMDPAGHGRAINMLTKTEMDEETDNKVH